MLSSVWLELQFQEVKKEDDKKLNHISSTVCQFLKNGLNNPTSLLFWDLESYVLFASAIDSISAKIWNVSVIFELVRLGPRLVG